MPLVELSSVSVELDHQVILERVDFTLKPREVVRVAGANGAGKSTLLKLLRGDLWHTSGERLYFFTDPPRSSPIGARERIGLVTPELQDRLKRLDYSRTGLELIHTGFEGKDYVYTPLTRIQLRRADDVLETLHLESLRDHPVREMSQGQLRRTLLARALVSEPVILLLDEFFAGVDPDARTHLQNVVNSLARGGLTVVYTTHRETETLETTTRTVTLEGGRVVQEARGGAALSARRAQHAAPLQIGSGLEGLIEVRGANVFLGDPQDDLTALDGHAASSRRHVLHDLDFTLRRGEHTALFGANGAGKTTFARLLRGEVTPALGGSVRWFGRETVPLWERFARIGSVSGDADARHRVDTDGFTVVASGYAGGVGWHRALKDTERTRVHTLLETLGVADLETRNALTLSQGELRKLLVARAFVTQPDVLILDEAFDYLDATSRDALFDALETLAAQTTLLVISHRASEVPAFVTNGIRLVSGRIVDTSEHTNSET